MARQLAMRIMKIFIFAIVFLGIFAAGFGSAVLYLWNWLMPSIFGLHTISYWQALGLLGLCWLLFTGPRGWMGPRLYQRQRMRERWGRMSPEEREKFRAGMRARCGGFQQPAAEPK
ncbi:MAG TPA: hypothetical protein VJO35_09705 [Terriglobales bacterium]|nr:hypothetical protein [Terriglobales bacterium]